MVNRPRVLRFGQLIRRSPLPARRCRALALCVTALLGVSATTAREAAAQNPAARNRIVHLLAGGSAVFGIFSGDHTAAQGAVMAGNSETDFIFYSLESGPFDLPGMQAYMAGMREASGAVGPHPLALRIPPIRAGRDSARARVRQAIEAGVDAIVFPHVETADDAAFAVRSMGRELWPENAQGRFVAMLIIEDQVGVQNARAIAGTPGVSVVFAGPGDLRRAYNGDMNAVERAIQVVLSACKEFSVPCGITAGETDIAGRLAQGFRVIIVTRPEALSVGRKAAGRTN
jgi:4-hydroxy-2-oxoheptanedioate aldolase